LKQQLDAALSASEVPSDGSAAAAITDEAEAARLERRASDLRARLDARSARLQELLAQQQRLDALSFVDSSGGSGEAGKTPEAASAGPCLGRELLSEALSLGLAPHAVFGGLLAAAGTLRARAEALRARVAEAESEASLQRELAGLASDEAGDLRQQLEATQVGGAALALPSLATRPARLSGRSVLTWG
jgi:hypothetical protein